MREIKFNAWDTFDKKMLYWKDLSEHMIAEILLNSARYIPLQYTGLKDKNGKEIYEGDVVRWSHLDDSGIDQIMFLDGGFIVANSTLCFHRMYTKNIEVIGN